MINHGALFNQSKGLAVVDEESTPSALPLPHFFAGNVPVGSFVAWLILVVDWD